MDVNGTAAGSISLGGISITASTGPAVEAVSSSNFTVNQLTIDTHTTGAVGIELLDDSGTNTISNNNLSYGSTDGILIEATSAGTAYHIDGNSLTTSGTGTADGIIAIDAVGGNSFDESGNSIILTTASSSVGIEVVNLGGTLDPISSTANNSVTGATITSSFLGTTGTIEVNGTPEP